MLLNCKNEELVKYSKGTYNKDKFIQDVKDRWELTDKQIRMTYLISDLAENATGVFSIGHSTFVNMFEQRFEMKISLSSVRRFFELLSKIGVLSINAAKRKNHQQSANIYIIEPQIENEQPYEQPEEHAYEKVAEQPYERHNISLKNTLKNNVKEPLNELNSVVNNFVNNETQPFSNQLNSDFDKKTKTINKLTAQFVALGLNEEVIFRVIEEVENTSGVKNFGGYLRSCLENTLYKVDVKLGKISGPATFEELEKLTQGRIYNWLAYREESEPAAIDSSKLEFSGNPKFYDWLNS